MKTIFSKIGILALILLFSINIKAQKKTLTVLNIDSQGVSLKPNQIGNLLRMEVEKLDTFEVMDRYDVAYMIKKHSLDINGCYGKICLTEMGNLIGTDKILSGSVELYGKTIIITLRLLDVKKSKIEKAEVKEFLNIEDELQSMIRLTLQEMFNLQINELLMARLTDVQQQESLINNPNENRLNLSGPRLGLTYFTGETAEVLSKTTDDGGWDINVPVMFMFGYQFEVQYLNSGNFQALFEVIPTITGVDQGIIIPNLAFLMGFRNNVKGWEIALGPTIGLIKQSSGYYDENGNWHINQENQSEKRIDKRGDEEFHTGFVFAAGRSFKSGKMNFPVNLFVVPSNKGVRFGLTFGFNSKNKL
ncbi:MAG: hypothetical protein B6I24_00665 [Bacteroidetes bacterium 4572_128]|nr:MAG: hypothetical protein B6I24_00665 [Bacteroidetes bacterium 4572_128]